MFTSTTPGTGIKPEDGSCLSVETDDATNETGEGFSEWRIGTASFGKKGPAKGYRNCDFRNPLTGESFLPYEEYSQFIIEVDETLFPGMFLRLGLFSFGLMIVPCLLLASSWEHEWAYWILGFVAMLMLNFFVVALIGKCFDKRFENLYQGMVHQRREAYAEQYRIQLGYSPRTQAFWSWNDDSHFWLRRPHHSMSEVPSNVQDLGPYPRIYMSLRSPGDFHILEKEYDRSMKIDENTWTIIQETHKKILKNVSKTCLKVFMLVRLIVLFTYIGFLGKLLEVTYGGAMFGLLLLLCLFFPIIIHDTKLILETHRSVCNEVTRIINNETNFLFEKDGKSGKNVTIPVPQDMIGYALVHAGGHSEDMIDSRYQLVPLKR